MSPTVLSDIFRTPFPQNFIEDTLGYEIAPGMCRLILKKGYSRRCRIIQRMEPGRKR